MQAFAECLFKRNGFLTTPKTLNYEAIANHYMRSQNNIRWQFALQSTTASIKAELESKIVVNQVVLAKLVSAGLVAVVNVTLTL